MSEKSKPILFLEHNDPVLKPTAECDQGCAYVYWVIDRLAMQETDECAICEQEVDRGWLCLDGGQVYCDDCVIIANDLDFGETEFKLLDAAMEQAGIFQAPPESPISALIALKAATKWLALWEIKVHNVRNNINAVIASASGE